MIMAKKANVKKANLGFVIRWKIGMFCMRIADRIFHKWGLRVCAKLNITKEDMKKAFFENVEAWNL